MSHPTWGDKTGTGRTGQGGLAPKPLNAPVGISAQIGVQPGATPGIFTGFLVIVGGTGGPVTGVFVYSGTPAAGNPPIASMSNSTVDPFGNTVLPGIASYNAANTVQLQNAEVAFGNGVAITGFVATNLLQFIGTLGTNAISFTLPVEGLVAIHPGGGATPESWQVPTTTGFTASAGNNPVEYQLSADQNIDIQGLMVASGAYTAGTTIWTQPVGYRPHATVAIPIVIDTAGTFTSAWLAITSAGVVSISVNVASAALVTISGRYRLVT